MNTAKWTEKKPLRVIGLMSGTSADGMDAALTEITGWGLETAVRMLGFVSIPYSEKLRHEILRLASGSEGGSRDLTLFSFLLGKISLDACLAVCSQAGINPADVDLVGSHGQTLFHQPTAVDYLETQVRGTLQLGEPSVICEGLGCPVVSDFRVRDLAAGGQGAPLVPYAEYLLYRQENRTIGLQNIGGIGNLTLLPAHGRPEDTLAFDTGPGNMLIDQLMERFSGGKSRYDVDGAFAASGRVQPELLAFLLSDPFLSKKPPKTTGREVYGSDFVDSLMQKAREFHVSPRDTVATVTWFTAECIRIAVTEFCPLQPEMLVIGGGGSRNGTLMHDIRTLLSVPVKTNEDLGYNSDAKEAVAFAILANECVHGICNNLPSATGASHPVVMGKISI